MRRFKFQGDRGALRFMARSMASAIQPWTASVGRRAIFVSVPMHRAKRRSRGLDQAATLAEAVARRLGRRFAPGVLLRVRPTLPQGDVRVTSRARNVAGAFRVPRPRRVDGAVVVLVDDVRTSGHTAMECARALTSAGACKVALLTAVQA